MKKNRDLLIFVFGAIVSIAGITGQTFAGGDKMIRIATVPAGAEVAGIAVNQVGELFFNAQHPGGKGEVKGDGPTALIGYIEGMDIRTYDGKTFKFLRRVHDPGFTWRPVNMSSWENPDKN